MSSSVEGARVAEISGARMRTPRLYFGWWVVFASMLGLMVSDGTVIVFTFGVFLNPIASEFGWTRGEVSLALTLHIAALAVCTPIVGWLIDRLGSRRVLLTGVVLFSAGVASLGLLGPSRPIMYAAFALLGSISAVVTPVPYARAICSWFDRRRGLALGIALSGVGLGAALLPQVAQLLLSSCGWRRAYVGLGLITLLISTPVLFALFREPRALERDDPPLRSTSKSAASSSPNCGYTPKEAIRRPEFWLLLSVFALTAAAVTGTAVHIVPLLTDAGWTASRAARIAAVLGLALLGGRVLSGYLMDRFFAPYVAMVLFGLAGCGMVILSGRVTTATGVLGSILVGMGIGAELDVLSYLSSRYFGLRGFAQISAYQFLGYVVGTSVGPSVMALTFDKVGTYRPALLAFAGVMALAGVLLSRLGPYPKHDTRLAHGVAS